MSLGVYNKITRLTIIALGRLISESSMSDDQRSDNRITIYARFDYDPFTEAANSHSLSIYPDQRIASRQLNGIISTADRADHN